MQSGRTVPIRGENVPYGSDRSWDLINKFFRMKLAPVPGAVISALGGENPVGQPTTWGKEFVTLPIPLSVGEIYDAMVANGVPGGMALGILSMHGLRMNTWQKRPGRGPRFPSPIPKPPPPSPVYPMPTWGR